MGRTLSSNMEAILSASKREIDYTLALAFPDETLHYATASLTVDSVFYNPYLESVGEVRQTLEAPIDRVEVKVQNKDRVLGLHVAANWEKWRSATAIIGRLYRAEGLTEWVEVFRGMVQRPDVRDAQNPQVGWDVIPDTLAPGEIVCNRNLSLPCWFVFKDPRTCAYIGVHENCNHLLKSKDGCDGRNNTHHFGGMEHRYPIKENVPGTNGNDEGLGGGTACPRLDQYVLVRGLNNAPSPKRVSLLAQTDLLFNPITQTFHRLKSLEIVFDVPIFELNVDGIISCASGSHPIIQSRVDERGKALASLLRAESALLWLSGLVDGCVARIRPLPSSAVMKIEMEDGHIYASGDSSTGFVVAHNVKPGHDFENLP